MWIWFPLLFFFYHRYPCTRATCKGASNSSQVRRRLGADATVNNFGTDTLGCWRISANKSDACQSHSLQCQSGAIGIFCGSCDDGFYYSSTDLFCRPCDDLKQKTLAILSTYIFVGVVVGMLYSGFLRIPQSMQHSMMLGLFQHFDSGTLRVVWSNYQVRYVLKLMLIIHSYVPFVSSSL